MFGLIHEPRSKHIRFANAYWRLLKELGPTRFAKCAELGFALDVVELGVSTENGLYEKVTQLVPGEILTEEERYKLAGQMNGSVHQFDIAGECSTLRSSHVFDLYNLVLVLSGEKSELNPSLKFCKLNEYNRICLQRVLGPDGT